MPSTFQLEKGTSFNLEKNSDNSTHNYVLELSWRGKGGRSLDLDSYVGMASGSKTEGIVYYGRLRAEGIHHHGDDLVGGGSVEQVNEAITITPDAIPPHITQLFLGVFVYSSGENFKAAEYAMLRFRDKSSGAVVAEQKKMLDVSNTHLELGAFERNGNNWVFKPTNVLNNARVGSLCSHYKGGNSPSAPQSSGGFFGAIRSIFS